MTINDVGGAIREGVVGSDVTIAGATLTWDASKVAKVGEVVRVVRPTGTYDDYAGIGFFSNPSLTPKEKGLERLAPVGEAPVVSVNGGAIEVGAAIPANAGDLVYLGDALPNSLADGNASLALAGSAGYTFAKSLVDASGARNVPHYRAIDMVSDNRIAPGAHAMTTHSFQLPAGCASATVSFTVIYRPIPVALARLRGWAAKDYVIAETSQVVPLP
jgi:hypothetical protein